MKFKNIMIVTDLDGTFYNSDHDFHPRNLEAVEYFTKNGGLFTIATGRVPQSLKNQLDTFKRITNAPAILCNGAFLYDFVEDKSFMMIALDREKATDIVKLVKENFSIFRTRGCFKGGEHTIEDISEPQLYEDWTRVSFDDRSTDTLNLIREAAEARYKDDFAFMFACPEIFEFQSKEATKGQGLDRLRRLLIENGKADESLRIYAVGDFENDLELLRHADVACCPENAIDLIKDVSDISLCHHNDGAIADLIDKIEKTI